RGAARTRRRLPRPAAATTAAGAPVKGIRDALGRMALIVLGIGLGFVALEVVLQLGAGLVRLTGRSLPSTWLTMHRRVLCLGDSNTFGIDVPVGDAYPPQLAEVWNRGSGRTVRIMLAGRSCSPTGIRTLPATSSPPRFS